MDYRGSMLAAVGGVVFAGALLFNGAAGAAPAPGQRQGPCSDDAAKYCKDVRPGGGRMARCLQQHEKELSPACTQHLSDLKKWGREFRTVCGDDVLKFCGDVPSGGGRVINCLKRHEQELAPDCRAQIQQKQQQRRQPEGK